MKCLQTDVTTRVRVTPGGSTTYSSAIDLSPAASINGVAFGTASYKNFSGTVVATATSMTLFLDGTTPYSKSHVSAFDCMSVTCLNAPMLGYVAPPSAETVGVPFSVTVQTQDGSGAAYDPTATTTITLSKVAGGGTLGGTTTGSISTSASSVTISGVTYSGLDTMTLQASATAGQTFTAVTSGNIVVSNPKLVYTTVPSTGTVGKVFSVTVQAQDANSNPVNVTTVTTVSLSKSAGGGSLSGTVTGTIATSASSVTISTPVYSAADTMTLVASETAGQTLTAVTSGNIVFSNPHLVYTTVPSTGTAGTAFSVTVQSQDVGGSGFNPTAATTITLSQASGGGSLSGTLTGSMSTSVNSVTISTPVYSKSDTMTLAASASGGQTMTAVTSGSIVFSAGAATKLAYTSVPASGSVGAGFNVTVQSQDAYSNPSDPTSTTTITLSRASGTGTVGGTTTGSISTSANNVTISGATYDTAETMTLKASATAGETSLGNITSPNIVFSTKVEPLRWSQGGTATWDIGTTANWLDSSATPVACIYVDTDQVQFEDTKSGTSPITVSLGTTVSPASLLVNNSTKTYTISGAGAINGSSALTEQGTGSLTLAVTGGYSGGTAIQNGTVIVSGSDNRLPTSTTVTLGSGSTSGILQLGDTAARIQQVAGLTTSGSGTANAVVGGYTSASTLTIDGGAAAVSYGGVLGGSGNGNNLALTLDGSGSVTLSGANTFTGGVTFEGTNLTVVAKTSATALGSSSGTLTFAGNLSGCTVGSHPTVEFDYDTGQSLGYNVACSSGSCVDPITINVGRATSGSGVTDTFGTVNIGNENLNVRVGANVTTGTPYGVTFGATTITAGGTVYFDVANNGSGVGTITLGALTGNGVNFGVNNTSGSSGGVVVLGSGSSRSSGSVSVSGGTLKLGSTSALGASACTITMNAACTLDLAADTTVNAYPTTVSATVTIASDKATATSAGITHTLGTLGIGANQLNVTAGGNVSGGSPGVTFGTTTLAPDPRCLTWPAA